MPALVAESSKNSTKQARNISSKSLVLASREGDRALEEQRTVNVYCRTCKIGSPRDPLELARPSGKTCLVCGAALVNEMPWPIVGKDNVPSEA
jgi:hypothetical protein